MIKISFLLTLIHLHILQKHFSELSLDTFTGDLKIREMLENGWSSPAFVRGLPTMKDISDSSYAPAVDHVRRLLQAPAGCISYENFHQVPEGAKDAYHLGWVALHDSDASTVTSFPTLFHRYRCSWLLSGRFDIPAKIHAMNSQQFIIAVVQLFSQMALLDHIGSHGKRSIPVAQYQHEIYRAAYELTGGRGIWLSPQFATSSVSSEVGRIDFFVERSKGWGIEILQQGDRTPEHLQQFQPSEAYNSWIQTHGLKEHIIIDFRSDNPQPRFERPGKFWSTYMSFPVFPSDCILSGCNLFYVIFDPESSHFQIKDGDHCEVANGSSEQF